MILFRISPPSPLYSFPGTKFCTEMNKAFHNVTLFYDIAGRENIFLPRKDSRDQCDWSELALKPETEWKAFTVETHFVKTATSTH